MSSTGEGEPSFDSSSSDRTSTGKAASSGVPAMIEPVTTTTSSFLLSSASCATAADIGPSVDAIRATALLARSACLIVILISSQIQIATDFLNSSLTVHREEDFPFSQSFLHR